MDHRQSLTTTGILVSTLAHLLSWLEENDTETYGRIIDADRESARQHEGHGNAIAQAYGHAILTLCNERDRRYQIRCGTGRFSLSLRARGGSHLAS
jgi:alpha-amylase/alpha-mannosidase (GH57 family)